MGGGLSVTYLYFEFGYNGLLLSIFSILGNVARLCPAVSPARS